jgi:hypothetical protein
VIKLKFGFVKVRYRGLAKNGNRLFSACALTNLLTARNYLLQVGVELRLKPTPYPKNQQNSAHPPPSPRNIAHVHSLATCSEFP